MREFAALLEEYTKLFNAYIDLRESASECKEILERLKFAVKNEYGIELDGVVYIPKNKAATFSINGMDFAGNPVIEMLDDSRLKFKENRKNVEFKPACIPDKIVNLIFGGDSQ